ncbi:hypothetical protein [Acidiphilium acidophilum]|uniref:hypothetical protein n=1 Tax=Acidiphilium acidophilum TaxID=76588 RepID=UPI002E8E65FC|nr:hypothetical protein [Acidiphilium acidophilum]
MSHPTPLRAALASAADAIASTLERIDTKLDLVLANMAADAAADRAELNGLRAPTPPKPRTNGHAGGQS